MNLNLNAKTWQSAITSVGLVVGGALSWAGIVSESSATEIVQQAVNAAPGLVASISALSTLGLTIYKAFQHTDSKVVQTASQVQGVEPIKIDPIASPALQQLARDSSVPTVQPASPPTVTTSTKGYRS